MNNLMQKLREKTGLKNLVNRTVEIDGMVLGIKSPNTFKLASLQSQCALKAEENLTRTHGEGKLKQLREQPSNETVEAQRQKAAEDQGVSLEPYANEYERLLAQEVESILILELVPLMVCDPDTGELLSKSPSDSAALQEIAGTNPKLFTAISQEMTDYGKRIQGMNADKKKPTRKRKSSKS
jgi:hypothetical protein